MKIVVFGGAGFLGSHVCDSLSKRGHEVVVYDKKKSPYKGSAGQTEVIGDILDEAKVTETVKGADAVYNFASIVDLATAKNNPLDTIKHNVMGTAIILDACRKNSVRRFLFASTIYVYSDSGAFYRSSKQSSELIIEDYKKIYGIDYTIMRYGSLYGPRSDSYNWIYRVLKQALTEGRITREGDGQEIREYIHVLDAARISADMLDDRYRNEYVIISGNQTIRIKDLLLMINEIMGKKLKIEFLPSDDEQHYEITPYSFKPRIARKVVSDSYLDLGQGILDMIHSIDSEIGSKDKKAVRTDA